MIVKTALHQKAIFTSQGRVRASEMQGSESRLQAGVWVSSPGTPYLRAGGHRAARPGSLDAVWTIAALTFL